MFYNFLAAQWGKFKFLHNRQGFNSKTTYFGFLNCKQSVFKKLFMEVSKQTNLVKKTRTKINNNENWEWSIDKMFLIIF